MLVEHARVDRGRLLAGAGVELGAHARRRAGRSPATRSAPCPGTACARGGARARPRARPRRASPCRSRSPSATERTEGIALGDDPDARVELGQPVRARRTAAWSTPRAVLAVALAVAPGAGAVAVAGRAAAARRGRGRRARRGRRDRRGRRGRRRARGRRRCRRAASSSTDLPAISGSSARRRPMRPRSRSTSTTRTAISSPLLSTSSTVVDALARRRRWRCAAGRRCPWRARRRRRTSSS